MTSMAFAGGLGTLQGNGHQADVIKGAVRINQFGAASECGFANGYLVFIDIADHTVRFRSLVNLPPIVIGVAIIDVDFCAFGMFAGRKTFQKTVKAEVSAL